MCERSCRFGVVYLRFWSYFCAFFGLTFNIGISFLCAVYTELLFPHGTANGDTALPRNDDSYSGVITLAAPITFFGTQQSNIFVNIAFIQT